MCRKQLWHEIGKFHSCTKVIHPQMMLLQMGFWYLNPLTFIRFHPAEWLTGSWMVVPKKRRLFRMVETMCWCQVCVILGASTVMGCLGHSNLPRPPLNPHDAKTVAKQLCYRIPESKDGSGWADAVSLLNDTRAISTWHQFLEWNKHIDVFFWGKRFYDIDIDSLILMFEIINWYFL